MEDENENAHRSENQMLEEEKEEVEKEKEETTTAEEESIDSPTEKKIITNKRRFIILCIVISVIELGGLFLFAYAFISEELPTGLPTLGLFLLPPFSGAAISYTLENPREAMVISTINASSSIIPFTIIYAIIESIIERPGTTFSINFYYVAIPILALLIQVAVATTLTRVRAIYREQERRSPELTKRDAALIEELKESRRKRGLEPYPEETPEGEEAIDLAEDELEEESTQIIEETINE